MNQNIEKPISDFTQKQKEAYQKAMKALAQRKLSKRQLFSVIKKADIYSRKRDCKEVTRMLIENPEVPISTDSKGDVVNELVEKNNA
ncbi:MAG: hypothetical protein ABEJ03_06305 [Candidatus Nanohaloarchaea archaeon]